MQVFLQTGHGCSAALSCAHACPNCDTLPSPPASTNSVGPPSARLGIHGHPLAAGPHFECLAAASGALDSTTLSPPPPAHPHVPGDAAPLVGPASSPRSGSPVRETSPPLQRPPFYPPGTARWQGLPICIVGLHAPSIPQARQDSKGCLYKLWDCMHLWVVMAGRVGIMCACLQFVFAMPLFFNNMRECERWRIAEWLTSDGFDVASWCGIPSQCTTKDTLANKPRASALPKTPWPTNQVCQSRALSCHQ